MFQIQNLTSDPKQRQTLVLPDGNLIVIEIEFIPLQLGWFITTLQYLNFAVNSIRICNSPNMLYQFRHQIPFGLACFSLTSQREPTQQEDFLTEASKLFVLSSDEVAQYTEYLRGT